MYKSLRLLILVLCFSCSEDLTPEYPFVYTGRSVEVETNSATFHAMVIQIDNEPIVEYGFKWGMDQSPIIHIYSETPDNKQIKRTYEAEINVDFIPNEKYFVAAFIKTDAVIITGNTVEFESLDTEIDLGEWGLVFDNGEGGWCSYPEATFSIGNMGYICFENGWLIEYDLLENDYRIIYSNSLIGSTHFAVSYNGKGYLFIDDSFYQFDPDSIGIKKLTPYGGESRRGSCGFRIKDKAYMGTGSIRDANDTFVNDFWEYDLESASWRRLTDFPGTKRQYGKALSVDSIGYIGFGRSELYYFGRNKFNDFWEYNVEEDIWIKRKDYPINSPSPRDIITFQNKGDIIVFYSDKLYVYNSMFDYWIKMKDFEASLCNPFGLNINTRCFVGDLTIQESNHYLEIWEYSKSK